MAFVPEPPPPPYVPPVPRKGRAALIVSLVVVALIAAIGAATVVGLHGRDHAGAAVAATGSVAPSTSALPPDQDPSRPEYRQAELARTIGAPDGFAVTRTNLSGQVLVYQYALHCFRAQCEPGAVAAIAGWAAAAGASGTEFAAANLRTCLPSLCETSYPRAGFRVQLTAASGVSAAAAQPGDVTYLAGVRIQRM